MDLGSVMCGYTPNTSSKRMAAISTDDIADER